MSDPFIGEIRIFANKYAPEGWFFCNGQQLACNQYQALFAVIGIRFGGDGRTTFNLPNLSGLAIMNQGSGPGLTPRAFAQSTGTNTVTLTAAQMPAHSHSVNTTIPGTTPDFSKLTTSPQGNAIGRGISVNSSGTFVNVPVFTRPSVPGMQPTTLDAQAIGATPAPGSGNQPHPNMQPYLALNFYICWDGEYPTPE